MDGMVSRSPLSPGAHDDPGHKLLIAGCSAPDIFKLLNAINGEGARQFIPVGFIDVDERKILEGHHGLPVWHQDRVSAAGFPGAAVAVNVANSMKLRWSVVHSLKAKGFIEFPALVHPRVDTWGVNIGEGAMILQGALLGPEVTINDFSLILMGAMVNHEAKIGRCSFLGPGSIVFGRATIGDRVYIGSGAVVFPGIHVGDNATVGAGAVVRENVPEGAVVAGIPARVLPR